MLVVFAISFFGACEITLPSSWSNAVDSKAEKTTGLFSIFLMAFTLALVSFSCTGPIIGFLLVEVSTSGSIVAPAIGMLGFAIALALPFTLFALFPAWLKQMPKSGGWMNVIKVSLGFIELAFALKFLSVADLAYGWRILDRETFLALWIVLFALLGVYLLGKIKFPHDDPEQKPLGVFRLTLVIAVFSFVVYMIPGMWGAPLKALSGYLPPIETQDFVVWNHADGAASASQPALRTGAKYDLKMPLGLDGYFTLEEGLEASREQGKPLFVDITGHGCVNCREMESRVWSDPRVLQKLRDEFVIVALYTDDKTKLDKQDWVTMDNGRVLKDLGRVNSYLVRERFGVNAQPNYALLDSDGNLLVPIRGYNLDIDAFLSFLQSGIDAYNAK